jgi:hypothetical protein
LPTLLSGSTYIFPKKILRFKRCRVFRIIYNGCRDEEGVEPDSWAPVLEAVTRCGPVAAAAVAGPAPPSAGAATTERGRRLPGPQGTYIKEFQAVFRIRMFLGLPDPSHKNVQRTEIMVAKKKILIKNFLA